MLIRFVGLVMVLWMLLTGLLLRLPRAAFDCQPFCWWQITVGSSIHDLNPALADQANGRRQQWTSPDQTEMSVILADKRIQRLEAAWTVPEAQPEWWRLLLLWGAPDKLRIETEAVANVRRMTATLIYLDGNIITLVTILRTSNDPQSFGDFRIQAKDKVLRISRYNSSTPFTLQTVDSWRGFRWYPVTRTCC